MRELPAGAQRRQDLPRLPHLPGRSRLQGQESAFGKQHMSAHEHARLRRTAGGRWQPAQRPMQPVQTPHCCLSMRVWPARMHAGAAPAAAPCTAAARPRAACARWRRRGGCARPARRPAAPPAARPPAPARRSSARRPGPAPRCPPPSCGAAARGSRAAACALRPPGAASAAVQGSGVLSTLFVCMGQPFK